MPAKSGRPRPAADSSHLPAEFPLARRNAPILETSSEAIHVCLFGQLGPVELGAQVPQWEYIRIEHPLCFVEMPVQLGDFRCIHVDIGNRLRLEFLLDRIPGAVAERDDEVGIDVLQLRAW